MIEYSLLENSEIQGREVWSHLRIN